MRDNKVKLLIEMYRRMVEIRVFELALAHLYREGKIQTASLHLCTGQEATEVGACFALEKQDYIVGNHRSNGINLARGADMNVVMAEIFGRASGCNGGRGGSIQLTVVDIGNLWSTGIVGAGLPIAVGSGLSAKLKKTGRVTLCFFGDGASSTGNFHESLNLASAWKLPVIFLCENNLYAVSTPVSSFGPSSIADRALSYSIPGVSIDGNDVWDVYHRVSEAIAQARNGGGSSLIECRTYRFEGHCMGDAPRLYRSSQEEDAWKRKDPISCLQRRLLKEGVLNQEEAKAIQKSAQRKVDTATKFSIESPKPSSTRAADFVYHSQ